MLHTLHSITNESHQETAMNPILTDNVAKKYDKARGKPYHAITNWKRAGTQKSYPLPSYAWLKVSKYF